MIHNTGAAMRTLATGLGVVGLTFAARVSVAQWSVSAHIGVARFKGSSRDTSGTRVGPYRPTTLELRVDRVVGPTRVAITVLRAKTGIAGERAGLAVVQYDAASLWEIAPQASLRLVHFGAGVDVRVEGGPAFELWDLNGEARNRVGGRAATVMEWPLAGGLTGSLHVNAVLSGSVFDASDAPSGVERLATRRLGVAVGLRYQL
jgi:hypothetical protein